VDVRRGGVELGGGTPHRDPEGQRRHAAHSPHAVRPHRRVGAPGQGGPQTVAPIEEIQLYVRDATGHRTNVTFQELVDKTMGLPVPRADLHIGRGSDGELFLTSRQDGTVRMLVP
jgi:hypothetical protein